MQTRLLYEPVKLGNNTPCVAAEPWMPALQIRLTTNITSFISILNYQVNSDQANLSTYFMLVKPGREGECSLNIIKLPNNMLENYLISADSGDSCHNTLFYTYPSHI